MHGFLAAAQERDVIIELTLFSSAYSDAVWGLNPLNIQNNINGVGDIPWQDYISGRDGTLMERQMAYVSKVVEEVNGYDNFYFEVCNEPFTARAGMIPETGFATQSEVDGWQEAVRARIRATEAGLPKKHLIFQVPVENWRTDTALEQILGEESVDAVNLHDYQQLTYKGYPGAAVAVHAARPAAGAHSAGVDGGSRDGQDRSFSTRTTRRRVRWTRSRGSCIANGPGRRSAAAATTT